MALVLNEEQVMLKDSAAGFLAEKATVAHLRELRDSGSERGFSGAAGTRKVQCGYRPPQLCALHTEPRRLGGRRFVFGAVPGWQGLHDQALRGGLSRDAGGA